MKKAFIIACLVPNRFYVLQTLTCLASLRQFHNEDVVIVTLEREAFLSEARKIKHVVSYEVREYHKLWWPSLEHSVWWVFQLDASKLNFWRLTDYDKVVALDPDIVFFDRFTAWNSPELTVSSGGSLSPVCTCSMILQPSETTFNEMLTLAQTSSFNFDRGWNDCGHYPHWIYPEKMADWNYCSAESTQGLLFYYFGILKKQLETSGAFFFNSFYHYGGSEKNKRRYFNEMRKFLGDQVFSLVKVL